jgi:hypothetical protein
MGGGIRSIGMDREGETFFVGGVLGYLRQYDLNSMKLMQDYSRIDEDGECFAVTCFN